MDLILAHIMKKKYDPLTSRSKKLIQNSVLLEIAEIFIVQLTPFYFNQNIRVILLVKPSTVFMAERADQGRYGHSKSKCKGCDYPIVCLL